VETIDDIETLATFLGNHIQDVDREEWFALLSDLAIQGLIPFKSSSIAGGFKWD